MPVLQLSKELLAGHLQTYDRLVLQLAKDNRQQCLRQVKQQIGPWHGADYLWCTCCQYQRCMPPSICSSSAQGLRIQAEKASHDLQLA